MARDDPQMKIRLPDELKERIETSAKEWGRSMNAEIVHMLQSYYKHVDSDVDSLQRSLEHQRKESISFGLQDGRDRAAVIHVLLLQEISLLKRRVDALGGRNAVLGMTKGEVMKRVEGPRLKGTHEEQTTYFSQTIGTTPLTALLTGEELNRLAERVVLLQEGHDQLQARGAKHSAVAARASEGDGEPPVENVPSVRKPPP